jgi:hypothetical protein
MLQLQLLKGNDHQHQGLQSAVKVPSTASERRKIDGLLAIIPLICTSLRFPFEKVLRRSWAYQRAAARGPRTFSLASSTQLTQSWSILSGFSLSQISNIGAQKLPIYENDLQNSEHYSFPGIQPCSSEERTILEAPILGESSPVPLYLDFGALSACPTGYSTISNTACCPSSVNPMVSVNI